MLKRLLLIAALTQPILAGGADLDLLYINRCAGGCNLTPGFNDAINRTSTIINQPTLIPEFPYGDASFDATVACVRSVVAPYDVTIVTADPGAVARREVILGGNASTIGAQTGTYGTAPWNSGTPIDNVIAFALAAEIGNNVDKLCWVAAQQFGTLYGLDHEYYCSDVMAYTTGCGIKTFTNVDAACGEFSSRACDTPGSPSTQNAAVKLSVAPGRAEIIFRGYFQAPGPSP